MMAQLKRPICFAGRAQGAASLMATTRLWRPSDDGQSGVIG